MAKPIDEMTKQELDDTLDQIAGCLTSILDEYFSEVKPGFVLLLGTTDYRASVCKIAQHQDMVAIIRRAADIIEAGQKEW